MIPTLATATCLIWFLVFMVGNDLGTLTAKFWRYLCAALALNVFTLLLFACS